MAVDDLTDNNQSPSKWLAVVELSPHPASMVMPETIVQGLTTKADKIRALGAAGFSRTDIAQFLGISYQHVRNTLVKGSSVAKSASARMLLAPTEPWSIERLINAGFETIGDCLLSADDAFGYTERAPTGAGVYVFAVDGFVTYVGLTRSGLRTRLNHYVYGHEGQRTSARVKRLILEALRLGRRVTVLVARPQELEWNGLPVDGPAGLETGLIRQIRPAWNQQGNRP